MARDLTKAQFAASLKRNGFKRMLMWMEDQQTRCSYGLILRSDGTVDRRASIAWGLRRRAEELKTKAA